MSTEPVELAGRVAVDPSGRKIGKIVRRYDDMGGRQGWVLVSPGLLRDEVLVPLAGAEVVGNTVHVAFSRERVIAAPTVLPGGVHEKIDELVRHYAATFPGIFSPRPDPGSEQADGIQVEMIRSEERLHVDRIPEPVERIRLRKRIVTEYVTKTVPVRREVIEVERYREPEGAPDEAVVPLDSEIADGVYEVVAYKEVPVVTMRVVPAERIRVRVVPVSEQATVADEVRLEQVDVVHEAVAQPDDGEALLPG